MERCNNVFTSNSNSHSDGVQKLREALDATSSGETTIVSWKLLTAPEAFAAGLTGSKETGFFGIEFRIGKTKQSPTPSPSFKPIPAEFPVGSGVSGPNASGKAIDGSSASAILDNCGGRKVTDREIEKFSQKGRYFCTCGHFDTLSPMGFKKHYNKCELKNRVQGA